MDCFETEQMPNRNFPHDSEYVEHEGETEDLPW